MGPSHGACCASFFCFFEALLFFVHNFCRIQMVAGISLLCSFSLRLASDSLLEFFVCVFLSSLEFSWEFFLQLFDVLLLDLLSKEFLFWLVIRRVLF